MKEFEVAQLSCFVKMLGCALDGRDHSRCCASSGVPMDECGSLCSGTVSSVDYRHFRCVEHLPTLANCALREKGVLPSAPRDFRFSNIGTDLGLLHWDPPSKLAGTVTNYVVHLRKVSPMAASERTWTTRDGRTDFVLEDLLPNSSYEAWRSRN